MSAVRRMRDTPTSDRDIDQQLVHQRGAAIIFTAPPEDVMATPRSGFDRASDERVQHPLDSAQRPPGSTDQRAPDGQRIVDARDDAAVDQAEIERAATHQEALAARERGTTPSTRFWDSPSARMGAILALLAGLLTLGMRVWPILPPQLHVDTRFPVWVATVAIGLAYLGGFFLADRRWQTARVLLVVAALAHLGIGLLAGASVQAETGEAGGFAFLLEAAPAVLALLAAFLIHGPKPVDREMTR